MVESKATEETLNYVNLGLDYDPYAADLLNAKMQISAVLGKNDDATRAFYRLALVAPNSPLVIKIKNDNHLK